MVPTPNPTLNPFCPQVPAATVIMRGGARHTSQASQEAAARSDTFSLAVALTVGEEGESEPIRTDFDQATLQP